MNSVEMKEFWEGEWERRPDRITNDGSYRGLTYCGHCSVLDIGCGNLAYFPFSIRVSKFVGIDISHKSLKSAKIKSPKGKVVAATATSLPFLDNSFDFVVSIDTLTLLGSEVYKAISEMKRVTKKKIIFNVTHDELARTGILGKKSKEREDYVLYKESSNLEKAVFTEEGIERLVRRLGLDIVDIFAVNRSDEKIPREVVTSPTSWGYDLKYKIYVLAQKN